MRGWRWNGADAALGVGLGIMLLGLSLAQSFPTDNACPAVDGLQNLTQPEYQNTVVADTGVAFMASLVHSFLHSVQPNPFPTDLIQTLIQDSSALYNQDFVQKILVYEVGFLVCVAIAVLYIVLMPIIGFFVACCRCCGNCGGKMYQKQTSSINCRRRTYYWFTFAITIIILAGNICMFRSNEALKVSVDQSPKELNDTISNLNTFLTSVPKQVDYVVNEGNKTVDEVDKKLNDIGPELGTQIQNRFRGLLDPALGSVKTLDKESRNISVQLDQLNSSLARLQTSMDGIQSNASALRSRINETLSKPECLHCAELKPELEKLTLDASISAPSLKELQSAVEEVVKINLQSKVDEVETSFNSIPQTVTNETKDVVQSSKQMLSNIKTKISQVTSGINLDSMATLSNDLSIVQNDINTYMPHIQDLELIRWGVCVALCCVILLVVVCNLLGLVLGPAGLKPKDPPSRRSCTADCGGIFLMMGAGFSFLFSWLLMIVVLALFLLGGNGYTLFCKPLKSGELIKFIDTPGLIKGYDLSAAFRQNDINVSISGVISDCQQNLPLWTAFHLNDVIDLEELLNVSQYTDKIQQQFDSVDINLSSITVLSPEIKNQLSNFSAKTDSFDSAAITQQLNKIASINLNTTAAQIAKLADNQTDNTIKAELAQEANDLRQIQANIDKNIIPQLANLNSSVKSLQSYGKKINGTVGEVLDNVGAAQDFLNTNTTQIVKTESKKFLNCLLDYFIAFADWAKLVVTTQVGRCGPLAEVVDSVEVIVCTYGVESLNAFWFSMGWCILFFIPSIIFSMKLAKYYRKMKSSDVYEDHIPMNSIPRAQMKYH